MDVNKRRALLIFPYNGNALEAIDCIGDNYRLLGFVDDTPEKIGTEANGYPIYDRGALTRFEDAYVLAVPGGPASFKERRRIIEGLSISEDRFATVLHPRSSISSLAKIGRNVLAMAGVVVTSNAVIGSHVCILPNSVIHHDVMVGDWTLVGSNVTIAGNTTVAENCYIGSGSSIMNGLKVGSRALIGIGTNVIKDVAEDNRVVGNPARSI